MAADDERDRAGDRRGRDDALVPTGDTGLVFDPTRESPLVGRGLERLRQRASPPGDLGLGALTDAVSEASFRLGSSLLETLDRPPTAGRYLFSPEQREMAWCCLLASASAGAPALGKDALARLGAVTDLAADEARYWWWNALPLLVALNIAGEGNGGYRILAGNLSHPQDLVRWELVQTGWLARNHLDPAGVGEPLLRNVEESRPYWPASLALLRAVHGSEGAFADAVRTFRPSRFPTRYHAPRRRPTAERDGPLHRYIVAPRHLLATERAVRDRIVAILREAEGTGS